MHKARSAQLAMQTSVANQVVQENNPSVQRKISFAANLQKGRRPSCLTPKRSLQNGSITTEWCYFFKKKLQNVGDILW
jgi:hypothetical protein